MELVVITSENMFPGEAEVLNRLFDEGMPILHLRKPGASEAQVSALIEGIEHSFRPCLVLHDHFGLVREYGLKGVHLNSRNPERPEFPVGHMSRSCHSLEEVEVAGDEYDYVFLSPIFDSISKVGYVHGFSEGALLRAKEQGIINEKVYALGGVDENTMPASARMGFGGVAILGTLWKEFLQGREVPEKKLKKLLAQAREL